MIPVFVFSALLFLDPPTNGAIPSAAPSSSPLNARASNRPPVGPAEIAKLLSTLRSKPAKRATLAAPGLRGAASSEVTMVAQNATHALSAQSSGRRVTTTSVMSDPGVQKMLEWTRACNAGAPSAPPEIWKIRGKIASGGYMVIEGACFGSAPKVELLGEFAPGKTPQLVTQAASSDSITVGIQGPPDGGIYDQTVRIRVTRGNVISNELTHSFLAEREPHDADASLIVDQSCGAATPAYPSEAKIDVTDCSAGAAKHFRHDETCVGHPRGGSRDRWVVNLPKGWSVDSIDYQYWAGDADIDFGNWNPSAPSFAVVWHDAFLEEHRGDPGSLAEGFGNAYPYCYDFYGLAYTLTVHASGPKGTWHSP